MSVCGLQNQGNLKAILPELVKMSKDKDVGIRSQVVWLLGRAGDDGLPPLADMLKDGEVQVRIERTSNMLRQLGNRAAKVMPAAPRRRALKDENPHVRLNCMSAVAACPEGEQGRSISPIASATKRTRRSARAFTTR